MKKLLLLIRNEGTIKHSIAMEFLMNEDVKLNINTNGKLLAFEFMN